MLWITFVLSCLSVECFGVLSPNDPKAVRDAEFSLLELKKLSDSRIYDTLSLSRVIRAEDEDGIYHYNTILRLELESVYFKSGLPAEEFDVVVMRNKVDGFMSFAINEFPEMDDIAVEKFWIKKVKEKRSQREEVFRKIEIESLIQNQYAL